MKDIAFSFGIITDGSSNAVNNYLPKVIESIRNLNIPEYEIILVGDSDKISNKFGKKQQDTHVVHFDERTKPKWITKKKNLITKNAKYENVVYQHDYIKFDPDWYEGYKKFGDDFHIAMNKIKTIDGERYRDWVIFPYHHAGKNKESERLWNFVGIKNNESMIPYAEDRYTYWQYVSGAYWVAKKSVMQEFPLDESLLWGQGEDVIWSAKIRKKYKLKMNANSTVHLVKEHKDAFGLMKDENLKKMEEYWNKINSGEWKIL